MNLPFLSNTSSSFARRPPASGFRFSGHVAADETNSAAAYDSSSSCKMPHIASPGGARSGSIVASNMEQGAFAELCHVIKKEQQEFGNKRQIKQREEEKALKFKKAESERQIMEQAMLEEAYEQYQKDLLDSLVSLAQGRMNLELTELQTAESFLFRNIIMGSERISRKKMMKICSSFKLFIPRQELIYKEDITRYGLAHQEDEELDAIQWWEEETRAELQYRESHLVNLDEILRAEMLQLKVDCSEVFVSIRAVKELENLRQKEEIGRSQFEVEQNYDRNVLLNSAHFQKEVTKGMEASRIEIEKRLYEEKQLRDSTVQQAEEEFAGDHEMHALAFSDYDQYKWLRDEMMQDRLQLNRAEKNARKKVNEMESDHWFSIMHETELFQLKLKKEKQFELFSFQTEELMWVEDMSRGEIDSKEIAVRLFIEKHCQQVTQQQQEEEDESFTVIALVASPQ